MTSLIENKSSASLSLILSAAKKLSMEEKQLLRIKLFAKEGIKEMKEFEATLKKNRKPIKKKDAEIVRIVKAIRLKNAKGAA